MVSRSSRAGFTLIELLVSIAVIGILVALIVPAVQAARESARKTECKNNLKQISLAAANFESAYGHLPGNGWGFLWIGDPDRGVDQRQPGGWIYQLLPYIEQDLLANLGEGLTGTEKEQALGDLTQTYLKVFDCPSRPGGQLGPFNPGLIPRNAEFRESIFKTDYAINEGDWISDTRAGPDTLEDGDYNVYVWKDLTEVTGVSFQRSRLPVAAIRDGTSNTYFAGEKNVSRRGYGTHIDPGHDQPCYSGVDLDLNRWTIDPPQQDAEQIAARRFGSVHAQGCHMLFCDGSVKFISYSIDGETHRLLGNRADGIPVEIP